MVIKPFIYILIYNKVKIRLSNLGVLVQFASVSESESVN
jgi:hypothetical protein